MFHLLGHLIDQAYVLGMASLMNSAFITAHSPIPKYGSFIQTIVNFLIISFSIFIVIRTLNGLRRKKEAAEEEAAEEAVDAQEELLKEIRDLLKQQAKSPE
ncbi:MAG: large conductance mechanosensitive channel protein MscL [Bacillota bacterium]|nr:large conductance mechanosensitive channel protein MscL [Bacillota bacterium]